MGILAAADGHELGGRNPVAPEKILGENLAALQARILRRGPDDGPARRVKLVDNARDQRRFGTDDRQVRLHLLRDR